MLRKGIRLCDLIRFDKLNCPLGKRIRLNVETGIAGKVLK